MRRPVDPRTRITGVGFGTLVPLHSCIGVVAFVKAMLGIAERVLRWNCRAVPIVMPMI